MYTDRVSTCSDYVWYTGENLNANSALHVGPLHLHLCYASHPSEKTSIYWLTDDPIILCMRLHARSASERIPVTIKSA